MPGIPFIEAIQKWDPELYKAVSGVVQTAMGPGALDQKTKVLITLALDAAHGAREGVVSLAGQARSLGASDAEIAEAIRIAYFVAGNSVLAAAGAAFAK